MDQLKGLFARASDNENTNPDDTPWWMKHLARAAGTIGGGIAVICGLFACTSIIFADIGCLFGGVFLMLAGCLAILIESPCCCPCIDFVSSLSNFIEKKPHWHRAAAYIAIAILPLTLCRNFSIFFGSACLFGTGVLYGLMALGRKASRDEMSSNVLSAGGGGGGIPTMKSSLVNNEQPPAFTDRFDSNI